MKLHLYHAGPGFHLHYEYRVYISYIILYNVCTFLPHRPEVLFAVRVLSLVQVMEIPLLKAWLQRVVEDGFTHALVDPGRVDFKFETYGPTNIPDTVKSKSKGDFVQANLLQKLCYFNCYTAA